MLCPSSYLIASSVIYLVITDRSYPRKQAFAYLNEIATEFAKVYGDKVDGTQRPYAFVGFGKSNHITLDLNSHVLSDDLS